MAVAWIFVVSFVAVHLASGTSTKESKQMEVYAKTGVCETAAFDNLANGKLTGDPGTNAGRAVDGDIQTTLPGKSPKWWVDMGTEHLTQDDIIKVYFNTDYKWRRNGVQLYTSTEDFTPPDTNHLCYNVTGRPDGTDIPDVITVYCPGSWRYLIIYTGTDNDGQGAFLDFGEVEVLDTIENVARGIDLHQVTSYWWVDINKIITDAVVKVRLPANNTPRRDSVEMYTNVTGFKPPSGQLCKPVTGTDIPNVITVNCTGLWQYLVVSPTSSNKLNLAEVQVLVCKEGTYGDNCSKFCKSRQCTASTTSCDRYTGACPLGVCQTGWTGTDCTDCVTGMYGEICNKKCRSRQCGTESSSCERYSGACSGGCKAGWERVDCSQVCPPKTYGDKCQQLCTNRHCLKSSNTCDHVTGACSLDGCSAGWNGIDCTQECPSETYGNNCQQSCTRRHCVRSSEICDHVKGTCPLGCSAGWMGTDCTEICTRGETYGVNCKKNCTARHCKTPSSSCAQETGQCLAGCLNGWTGEDCTQPCVNDTYGPDCKMSCGDRKCKASSSSCEHVSGQCDSGCRSGWNGTDCIQECPSGTYGDKCQQICISRHCLKPSIICDRVNGTCSSNGCSAGWMGIDCTENCTSGTYGVSCKKNCTARHCRTPSSPCDRGNGQCYDGCHDGWTGEDCSTQCPNGTFGLNCSSCSTRHCLGESDCPGDGACSGGCQNGWTLNSCTQVCPNGNYGSNCNSTCGNCTQSGDNGCDHVTGECTGGCQAGWQGRHCKQSCQSRTYGINCTTPCGHCNDVCDAITGHCPGGCEEGYNGTLCKIALQTGNPGTAGSSVGAAVGGTVAAVLVIVIIIIGFIVYRRRNSPSAKDYEQSESQSSVSLNESPGKRSRNEEGGNVYVNVASALEPEEILDEDEPAPSSDYYNVSEEVIREVNVEDLTATIQKIKHRLGGFETEFNRLPAGFTAPYDDSQKPENLGKNKFRGYYPYNENRVRLSILPDIPGSDYINASHMHNYDKKKAYIASQAPNKKTVGDFWRMIWEHRCNRVIMLTGLVEAAKVKCYKYWPDEDALETDHHKVEVEVTDTRANFTIRRLKVTSKKMGQCRTVVQYHYTSWPDHGVPDTLALVNFIWMIRRSDTSTDGPMLVHCSAGIGRTGTYIAIDSLLDQARNEGRVDVQGYVTAMRAERKNMIQTKEQYECVFHCLVEMTTFGNTSMDVENFTTSYSSRGMDSMVDRKTIRELTQMATSEKRNDDPDRHRMWVDGNQKFIVRVGPTMRNMGGYLQAVIPSVRLENLLWKLVEENNVQDVIVVSPLQVELVAERGVTKAYGDITLKTTELTNVSSNLSLVTLRLQIKSNGYSRDVKFFKLSGSPTMDSMSSCLLNHVNLQHLSSETSPVVIVHSEADRKCAVSFCIMGNILSGIKEDHRADVIGHVRTFLKCCPDLTFTGQDVEKLHDFAQKCVQMTRATNTYANM